MEPARYWKLELTGSSLTDQEACEGWHYCPDWDGLLIGPGMTEYEECCTCDKPTSHSDS